MRQSHFDELYHVITLNFLLNSKCNNVAQIFRVKYPHFTLQSQCHTCFFFYNTNCCVSEVIIFNFQYYGYSHLFCVNKSKYWLLQTKFKTGIIFPLRYCHVQNIIHLVSKCYVYQLVKLLKYDYLKIDHD